MSYILKGFVSFTSTIAATQTTVASIGELSSLALTYSRNKQLIVNSSTAASYALTSFISNQDNVNTTIPNSISSEVFYITDWIANIQSGSGAATTSAELINLVTNNLSTKYTNFNCGNLVLAPGGAHIPTWIKFTILNLTGGFTVNEIKLWYSSQRFEIEYDSYEAVVIPPIENIEQLFSIKSTVQNLIRDYNDNVYPDKINLSSINNPYSRLVKENFTWRQPQNPTITLSTRWTIVLYGNLQNPIEDIKTIIRNYISQNSSRPESDWRAILPDLYINTEFYIIPRWFNPAINQINTSQYSPFINFKKELDYVKNRLNLNFPILHVDTYLESMPVQFKSLACIIIPGLDNRDNLFSIYQLYNDFINVPTSDPLYSQMSTSTRNWLTRLINAIYLSETITNDDTIDVTNVNYIGFRKSIKGNILYVSFRENGIDYFICTKNNTPSYV